MEAVFPIGPLGVPITHEGEFDGPAQQMPRFVIKKENGRKIQTANFLDPIFTNVSAVVQGHQRDMFEKDLALSTVHNPLASNHLPTRLFGASKEFVAEERGDEYEIKDMAMKP
jgi:hypothetical protein